MKKMIIASTSTVHGSGYLEYLKEELNTFFSQIESILFVPYARPGGISYDEYTSIAKKGFESLEKEVVGIHSFKDPVQAVNKANGIFVGGGNTFLLVTELYKNKLITPLRENISKGLPYLGTSAGANITGVSMQTTNDMPIIYPPSFKTLEAVPFNINPHYLDPIPGSKHKGETRETRIKEFHEFNTVPVVGLREGSWLSVTGDEITLKGNLEARIFEAGKKPFELATNSKVIL
ncbi:dipeptidase PepE [Flavobacteriaceae bacterium R38]|nr:dipeptidase PepE [Flavobacteriaceae bacterium R38]